MRSTSVLLSALLVCSGVLAPVAASNPGPRAVVVGSDGPSATPEVVAVENASNYLAVPADEVRRSESATVGLDAGTAVTMHTNALSSELFGRSFERRYDAASSAAERRALLETYAQRIERRQKTLRHRDSVAVRRLANGSISEDAFVRRRADVHNDSEQLQQTIRTILDTVERDGQYTPSQNLRYQFINTSFELRMRQGPVSNLSARVADGSSRGSENPSVYVEASTTGYTLATIDGTSYVRETYLGDQRERGGPDRIASSEGGPVEYLINFGNEQYLPSADSGTSLDKETSMDRLWETEIYLFSASSRTGGVTAYIDGTTKNVFREHQRHLLSSIETLHRDRATNGTLAVTLNRTYATGPMEVSVSRTDSDLPAPANVTINGTPVGPTGADGKLWVVEPRGAYTLNVTAQNGDRVTYRAS